MKLDWKRLLRLEQHEVLGLDIGSSTVKVVQLRKDKGGWAVTAAGIVDIVDEVGNNEKHKEMNITKAINDCLELTGVQTQFAVCGVCGPEVAVRYFKFPPLQPEEIPGAVLLEAEQVCPFSVKGGAVDYQLMQNGDNNISGILVAATGKQIGRKNRLAKTVSLDNVLMDVDGLALLNCFSECEKPEAGWATAILNVGKSFANLAIIGKDSLPFVRDIAYAGDSIINEIEEYSRHQANNDKHEKLDIKHHAPDTELLDKACQKLITNIAETLRYYAAQKNSSVVNKVFVCGGFALVKGFVELLDSQLSATAVSWNPFDKIHCHTESQQHGIQDTIYKNGPAMAVAAGLAMRSI